MEKGKRIVQKHITLHKQAERKGVKIKISNIQILIDKIRTHGLTRYVVVSKMILLRQNNLLSLLLVQGYKGNLVSEL